MSADSNIVGRLRVVEGEADGSQCGFCGDPLFLKAWKIEIQFPVNKLECFSKQFCDSCRDIVEELL